MARRLSIYLSDEDEARMGELTLAGVIDGKIAKGDYGEVVLDEHGMEIRQMDVVDPDDAEGVKFRHDREQLHAKATERLRDAAGPDRMFILLTSTGDGVEFLLGGDMPEDKGNAFMLASLTVVGRTCDELGLLP